MVGWGSKRKQMGTNQQLRLLWHLFLVIAVKLQSEVCSHLRLENVVHHVHQFHIKFIPDFHPTCAQVMPSQIFPGNCTFSDPLVPFFTKGQICIFLAYLNIMLTCLYVQCNLSCCQYTFRSDPFDCTVRNRGQNPQQNCSEANMLQPSELAKSSVFQTVPKF